MSTTIIVGAGIVGSALAHFLSSSSSKPKGKIILIDHSFKPLQGSTAHAPGYIGQFNESATLTRLAIDTVIEYAKIPNGFNVLGGIEAVGTEEGLSRLQVRGLPASMITATQAAGLAPDFVRKEALKGALYFATDGVANATVITEFYQHEARKKGVEFVEGVVTRIKYNEDGDVVGVEVDVDDNEQDEDESDKRKVKRFIASDTLILATGIWTQDLCSDLDIPIPIIPVAHPYMYIKHDRLQNDDDAASGNTTTTTTTTSPSSPKSSTKSHLSPRLHNKPSPWIRYPEHHVYARDHGPFYGVGTYNHGPAIQCQPTDHVAIGPWYEEIFSSALEQAKALLPVLRICDNESVEYSMPETKFNGIFAMTPDNLPIAGKVDGRKGLVLCAAVWVTHAAGVARFVAGLIERHNDDYGKGLDGDVVRHLDPARFRGRDFEELRELSLRGYSQIYCTGEN
ncbi:N,N-dimethylglycine oxidase [Talaromyces stipitatus ATCC 10500]|uniref:N,N-dimethylglycine oxidase n=1 Tax=Talaromyces stipitatus (strain ATCC 10500 / CBS 375.48 / QM 6759 / NRRL 1006) TaxID=441959 RepID=B8MKI7_TALSN|nr:N,N-dimethylglycine oxidase [Talaromyces stipitatus ATCC 10500]EED15342.1 N,N-dimethylglycine oxidase [Talaromyces stipitatus ATCC 10500]